MPDRDCDSDVDCVEVCVRDWDWDNVPVCEGVWDWLWDRDRDGLWVADAVRERVDDRLGEADWVWDWVRDRLCVATGEPEPTSDAEPASDPEAASSESDAVAGFERLSEGGASEPVSATVALANKVVDGSPEALSVINGWPLWEIESLATSVSDSSSETDSDAACDRVASKDAEANAVPETELGTADWVPDGDADSEKISCTVLDADSEGGAEIESVWERDWERDADSENEAGSEGGGWVMLSMGSSDRLEDADCEDDGESDALPVADRVGGRLLVACGE